MPTSAPIYIHTPDHIVNVLQLTDLHLYTDINKVSVGVHLYDSFIGCLNQALAQDIRCDLILVTGDVVNEVNKEIYDRVFSILEETGIPFACIAGNHDVTDELNHHLPFKERTLVAQAADPRLVNQHCITAEDWQILLLDSSIPGKVGGQMDADIRQWLDCTLAESNHPTVIFMHHHTIAMDSRWIDTHITKDADLFWQLLAKYPQVKAVINGHVHQEYVGMHNNVKVYSTPSTCYQFKPLSDIFVLDTDAKPGYRWLTLKTDATVESWVDRLTS